MADKFVNLDKVEAPSRDMFLIAPHATNEVDPLPKAIRADGAGSITLRAVDSDADVTFNMVAGEQLAVRAQFVRSADMTIHGLA